MGWFVCRVRTTEWAVVLKICRGAKFTPSFTWKWKPPDKAPTNSQHQENRGVVIFIFLFHPIHKCGPKTLLTTVHKHQLSGSYVILGEVEDLSGGGPLKRQVAVARWRDDELQSLRFRSVWVLCTKIIGGDFCHWTHPHLRENRGKDGWIKLMQSDSF